MLPGKEGVFYTKQKSEIIQDEIVTLPVNNENTQSEQPKEEPVKTESSERTPIEACAAPPTPFAEPKPASAVAIDIA